MGEARSFPPPVAAMGAERISPSYTYTTRTERADEEELSRILHEEVPLVADMTKAEVDRLRKNGLHLHCEFEW